MMPKMAWRDGYGLVPEGFVPPKAQKEPQETTKMSSATRVDDTRVDEHPAVVDEPHSSTNDPRPVDKEAHNRKYDEHKEDHGMTEDEINETSTEEPPTNWFKVQDRKVIAIGVGVLVLLFIIVVSLTSGHPWLLGPVGFACPALVGYFYVRNGRKGKARSLPAYALLMFIALVVLVICWMLMAQGSSPTGPYGP